MDAIARGELQCPRISDNSKTTEVEGYKRCEVCQFHNDPLET